MTKIKSKFINYDTTTLTNDGDSLKVNVGTSANNIVQLDSNSKLPAIDGSQLTNLPSGSSGISLFECTVGASGADYTTLGAAITAGKTRLLLIDNTTETGDINLPDDLYVQGLGPDKVNIDMGSYDFPEVSTNKFIFKDLKITFAYSGTNNLFTNADDLNLENIYFVNNSTANNTRTIFNADGNSNLNINNCVFILPNYQGNGIYISGQNNDAVKGKYMTNSTFIGGGSSCLLGISASYFSMSNITFTGTWNSAITSGALQLTTGASLNNFYGETIIRMVVLSNAKLNNIWLGNGTSDRIILGGNSSISNFTCGLIECYSQGGMWSNGYISSGNASNISAANHLFSNIKFYGGVTVNGHDASIVNCQAGTDIGGGSSTITVTSGYSRTIISGCRTDTVIVDNGTDTVEIGNVVY